MPMEHESGTDGQATRNVVAALLGDIRSGALRSGQQLLTQRQLAEQYGVAPGTVTKAIAELKRLDLLAAIPGRGTFVKGAETRVAPGASTGRAKPAGVNLEERLRHALEAAAVGIDAISWTGETFAEGLGRELGRLQVVEGAPRDRLIKVRLLITDPRAVGTVMGQRVDGQEDERLRDRLASIAAEAVARIDGRLRRLVESVQIDEDSSVEVRTVPFPPMHEVYLLNDEEVLFVPYEFKPGRLRLDKGDEVIEIHDMHGQSPDPVPFGREAQLLRSHRRLFDSLWDNLGAPTALGQVK